MEKQEGLLTARPFTIMMSRNGAWGVSKLRGAAQKNICDQCQPQQKGEIEGLTRKQNDGGGLYITSNMPRDVPHKEAKSPNIYKSNNRRLDSIGRPGLTCFKTFIPRKT